MSICAVETCQVPLVIPRAYPLLGRPPGPLKVALDLMDTGLGFNEVVETPRGPPPGNSVDETLDGEERVMKVDPLAFRVGCRSTRGSGRPNS